MSMPGFVFYFRCDSCDVNSEDYPIFPFHDIFRPEILLPAWSRTHRCWARIQLSLSSEQRAKLEANPQNLIDFAAALSSDAFTVCVPQMHPDNEECKVFMTPESVCPYCKNSCHTIVGYSPEEQKLSATSIPPEEWDMVPLSAINISVRSRNICTKIGIRTLGQLREKRGAVVSHKQASDTTIAEIDQWLALVKRE